MLIFLSNLGMGGTTNEAVVVTDTWVALSSPSDTWVNTRDNTDTIAQYADGSYYADGDIMAEGNRDAWGRKVDITDNWVSLN